MSDSPQPTFLVSAYTEPVQVRINGKANYLNCNSFRDFIEQMLAQGRKQFLINFANCLGMDSTFLGILAGTALELRNCTPPGKLTLCQLSPRNHELVTNLGLEHLLTISDATDTKSGEVGRFDGLKNEEVSEAKNILKAHENLAFADENNLIKFQDVIAFLKNQVEKDEAE